MPIRQRLLDLHAIYLLCTVPLQSFTCARMVKVGGNRSPGVHLKLILHVQTTFGNNKPSEWRMLNFYALNHPVDDIFVTQVVLATLASFTKRPVSSSGRTIKTLKWISASMDEALRVAAEQDIPTACNGASGELNWASSVMQTMHRALDDSSVILIKTGTNSTLHGVEA